METVQEVLNDATAKIGKSFDTLKSQFAGLRTGKASPAMVDQIKVDYYGCPTPIKNLGTISTPEPRQIKIAPFDPTVLDAMNKAILAANIGVTPQTEPLTSASLPRPTARSSGSRSLSSTRSAARRSSRLRRPRPRHRRSPCATSAATRTTP